MSTNRNKIEKGKIRELFAKPKSGFHKWVKRQMNKYMRRKPIEEDDKGCKTNKKPIKGWEF
jgi:hypothetical protein